MPLATHVPSLSVAVGLDVSVRREHATTVMALRGEADVATLPVLVQALTRIAADGEGNVVVDLSQLEFMDTATIRAVLGARAVLAGNGRELTLRSPSRISERVLGVFGLTHLVGPPATALR